MSPFDLRKICDDVLDLSSEVGTFISSHLNKVGNGDIEAKEKHSLVTYVDKTAEEMLVKGLSRIIPDAGFITEEGTVDQSKEGLHWIIDPLDGTTNFIYKIPHFSISIALYDGEEGLIGVVEEVNSREQFSAIKGGGAFLNGLKMQVSQRPLFEEAVVATGFPYRKDFDPNQYFEVISFILKNGRGIRRMGSAALDLSYVAAGRLDAYYEGSLNPWDIAAGSLIVKEAGGMVSTFSGGSDYYSGKEILASAPQHFDILQKKLEKHLLKTA